MGTCMESNDVKPVVSELDSVGDIPGRAMSIPVKIGLSALTVLTLIIYLISIAASTK